MVSVQPPEPAGQGERSLQRQGRSVEEGSGEHKFSLYHATGVGIQLSPASRRSFEWVVP